MDYLTDAGLVPYLEELNFNLVGYGCTTCIGNSGPLPDEVAAAVQKEKLTVAGVLSGNRNFEGRVNPLVRANYLASPPLVVAYALAGRVDLDLANEPIGQDQHGHDVFLRDIWPTPEEVQAAVKKSVRREMFAKQYSEVFAGDAHVELDQGSGGRSVRVGRCTRPTSSARRISIDMADPKTHVQGFEGRAGAGRAGRFGDHRSHFAGGQHRGR